jgi:hypothetical protein
MKLLYQTIGALLLLVILNSCSTTRYPYPRDERRDKDRKEREKERDKEWEKNRDKDEDGRIFPFSSLGIPKGHLPPPGECKIWIPGRPPGQQGPPQSCPSALRNAPLGAWIITHTGNRYKVNLFSRTRRNVIEEVRYYDAKE